MESPHAFLDLLSVFFFFLPLVRSQVITMISFRSIFHLSPLDIGFPYFAFSGSSPVIILVELRTNLPFSPCGLRILPSIPHSSLSCQSSTIPPPRAWYHLPIRGFPFLMVPLLSSNPKPPPYALPIVRGLFEISLFCCCRFVIPGRNAKTPLLRIRPIHYP